MKRFIMLFSAVIFVGIFASLSTKNLIKNDITLNNIAALSSAQAEDWEDHYCLLISTDLCYVNTNTYPFPPIVIYGLHRY